MFSNIRPEAEGDNPAAAANEFATKRRQNTSYQSISQQNNDREPIQVMVVGSDRGIESVIKGLHSLGFAEVGDWSKPQRYPNSDRSMSIVTKWRQL